MGIGHDCMDDFDKYVDLTTNDIFGDIHESLTGENCPVCGYPLVIEEGLTVCYQCGWYEGMEEEKDV